MGVEIPINQFCLPIVIFTPVINFVGEYHVSGKCRWADREAHGRDGVVLALRYVLCGPCYSMIYVFKTCVFRGLWGMNHIL